MHYQQRSGYYVFIFFFLFITFPHPIPARSMRATTGRDNSTSLSPRCGVSDNKDLHTNKHYSFFKGRPTWKHSTTPFTLYYALSRKHTIDYIKVSDIRIVLERAFWRWSSVIPINFAETQDYKHANITIGFYYGDHGDGSPFDDNVLGHAFGPGAGMLHFNAAIPWAINFKSKKPKEVYDLESVAVHEIGHVIGLDHSSIREAVMCPGLASRKKKADLTLDDVNGAQALYGSNPNFKLDSLKVKSFASKSSFGLREIITILISLAIGSQCM